MVEKYVPRTVKLEKEDDDRLKKVCTLNNVQVSTFMREAILDKLNSGAISNIAGKNKINYNPDNDSFDWIVALDDGREIEVLRNLSHEFITDLFKDIQFEISKRDELLKKKKKQSIEHHPFLPKK